MVKSGTVSLTFGGMILEDFAGNVLQIAKLSSNYICVATELPIPSEHCLSCCGTSRKPVLDHKYYGKRFNVQCIQQNSGLGTFINNIESIGQDSCMTRQSFARQIS